MNVAHDALVGTLISSVSPTFAAAGIVWVAAALARFIDGRWRAIPSASIARARAASAPPRGDAASARLRGRKAGSPPLLRSEASCAAG